MQTELEQVRARALTYERTLAACFRIMTDDQIRELRDTARFLDCLGGVSGGGG